MSENSPTAQGTVRVERMSPKDIQMRDLYVIVDDEPDETLLFNEYLELELSPGKHKIRVTNKLFSKSDEFDLIAGETVRYTVANVASKSPLGFLMTITGSAAYKVAIERR